VSVRLPLVGVVLLAIMVAMAGIDGRSQTVLFLAAAAGASAAYLLAVRIVLRAAPETRKGLWVCLALALACRVPLVLAEPTLSDDIYRYVWDGRIQRLGFNPYLSAPADPALVRLHTSVTRLTNHPELPTIYPPAAQWFFRVVASVDESPRAFKVAFVGCDALIVLLLLRWLRLTGHSPWRVLVYAWNPLVILEVAGSGHVDVLGTLLLMISFLALAGRRPLVAALSFVVAVEVKFLPIVLAPLFWRRLRGRDVALACVVALAMTAPFLSGNLGLPVGSLPTYLAGWRFNGPAFALVQRLIGSRWIVALPAFAGLVAAGGLRAQAMSPVAWAWPMAASLLLMPAVYPWYLVWLTPFLCLLETVPLIVWTQSSLVTYVVWRVSAGGGGWRLPWWALVLEYGSVACAIGWLAIRRFRQGVASASQPGEA
jgi:alpha-1,6-mannosyltransferase